MARHKSEFECDQTYFLNFGTIGLLGADHARGHHNLEDYYPRRFHDPVVRANMLLHRSI